MSVFEQIRSSSAFALRGLRSAGRSRPLAMRVGFFASLIVLAIACSDAGLPTAPTSALTAALSSESGGDEVPAGPTVTTDKPDYAPGEVVTISGSGFQPGEVVTLQLEENPEVHGTRSWPVTADENGAFEDTSFSPEVHHIGVTFLLTATGNESGLVATTTFEDGNIRVRASPSTLSINVSWELFTGSTNCTGSSSTGTVSGVGSAYTVIQATDAGQSLRLTAPVVSGYGFTSWTSGATTISTATACIPGSNGTQNWDANYTASAVHGAYTLESAADGSGNLIAAQNVASGASITAYLISRTSGGTFIANVAADSWSLQNKTGGVVDGDLVAALDMKSAEFTGDLVGSATIRGSKASENPETGTLTVIAGAHSAYTLEDAANGSGSTIPSQNVTSGTTVVAYLISRDAAGNFIDNVAADSWSLEGMTGGVVAGDLVAEADKKFATFTGSLVGSARIRATKGSDIPETGTLTVIPGPASKLAFTQQPSTSTVVNTAFAQQPKVAVQDAAGNTITGDNTTAITLNFKSGTGTAGAALSCTTNPVTVVSGVATFAGCKIDTAGEDYVLSATSSPAYTLADSDEFDITAVPTTLLYNSVFQVAVGQNLVMTATLSSSVSSCRSGKVIEFRVKDFDGNVVATEEGTTNANGVATVTVSTGATWEEGIYEVRVKFYGDGGCAKSKDDATLQVLLPGNAATGGGHLAGASGFTGRVNFGFNVRPIEKSDPLAYKGQLLLMNNEKWRCKGRIDSYGISLTGVHQASGACDLQAWNSGTEEWDVVAGGAGVQFRIQFADNGEGTKGKNAPDPDQFGFTVNWSGSGTPPDFGLTNLKGGNIQVHGTTSETTTSSPKGGGKNK